VCSRLERVEAVNRLVERDPLVGVSEFRVFAGLVVVRVTAVVAPTAAGPTCAPGDRVRRLAGSIVVREDVPPLEGRVKPAVVAFADRAGREDRLAVVSPLVKVRDELVGVVRRRPPEEQLVDGRVVPSATLGEVVASRGRTLRVVALLGVVDDRVVDTVVVEPEDVSEGLDRRRGVGLPGLTLGVGRVRNGSSTVLLDVIR